MSRISRPPALVFCVALTAAVAANAGAANVGAVNDAQIAQIVVTANTIDVENGRIALARSHAAGIDEFANLMVRDHTAVNAKAAALAGRLGVKPQPSETSDSLRSAADAEQAKLRSLDGAAFDREYLRNEVAYHEQVLDAIDGVLVPNAQNAELRQMLVDVRPAFQAHLEHARKALAALGGK